MSSSESDDALAVPLGSVFSSTPAEDPDWVKSFTPPRLQSRVQEAVSPLKRARVAKEKSISGSPSHGISAVVVDEDGILDLLSDDDDEEPESLPYAEPATMIENHGAVKTASVLSRKVSTEPGECARSSGTAVPSEDKPRGHRIRGSLPFVVASKMDDNSVLAQAQTAGLDLSGDVGAVGRVKVDSSGISLDMKGSVFKCGLVDTNTVCAVAVFDDEARITATFDQVLSLRLDLETFGERERLLSGMLDEDVDTVVPDQEDPRIPAKPKTKARSKTKAKPKQKVKKASGRRSRSS